MPEPKVVDDEETQDYAFLGREFMIWLLWRADRGEATFTDDDGDFAIAFGTRTRMVGTSADVTDAVLKGRSPAYGVEVRAAIGAGRTVREAELRLTRGEEREFQFTLVAETLDLKSVKLPALLKDESDDRLSERLELLNELENCIKVAYLEFIKERTRPAWHRSVVPALREWLVDGLAVA